MSVRLPRPVPWLLRIVLPARRVDAVLADLEDDYTRAVRRGGATLWLVRETASLLMAYAIAPFTNVRRSVPMWIRDLQMVARGLRRGPVAALGAAAMLSVGLLAVLITVSLAATLLFRPVSATHGTALRRIAAVDQQGRVDTRLSHLELQLIRDHVGAAGVMGSVYLLPVVLRARHTDVQTMAELVDGNYLALTGMQTIVGRGLLSTDDRPGAAPVVVLAEPFWRRVFGAAPGVLGQVVELNRSPYTVVGVAASLGSSSFLGASVDAWVPIAQADAIMDAGWRTDPARRWFTSFVLPRTSAELDARLDTAAIELARLYPDPWRHRRLQTADGTVLIGSQRSGVALLSAILIGLAALILAAAAANVGGVLLARAAASRRQSAIHMSMGSGRAVMIRRQLLEGVGLGVAGGFMAVAMYVWARTWFAEIALLPTLALRLQLPLDAPLIASVVAGGAGAGLLLALGPALWSTRVDVADALRDAEFRTETGRGLTRVRRVLVSTQVCLSLALIVGAGLFGRSIDALSGIDVGFPRAGLVAMDFDVEPSGRGAMDLPLLARQALTRAQSVPGVTAAAMSNRSPIDGSTPAVEVRAGNASAPLSDVTVYLATARYFETVGVAIVAGRAFTQTETEGNAGVAIVNETLAARLWPGSDAIDRTLHLEGQTLRVVGIARDSKYRTLSEVSRPHLYRPTPAAFGLTLLARTTGDARQVLRSLQQELDTVGPGLVGFFPRTMDDHLAIQLLPTRAATAAATGLGALALVLSAVGLYGLISWFVELRRREIGVRMALGATAGDVRRLVVRQAMSAALPGMVTGVTLAMALGVLSRSALFGVTPLDPVSIGGGIAVLTATVLAAGYLPGRRATRVDPATALRQ